MQKLADCTKEMAELKEVLLNSFKNMPHVIAVQASEQSDTIVLLLTLSFDDGDKSSFDDEKQKSCQLTLYVTGFARKICEISLSPSGNVLQHGTARAVVNYITNMMYANAYLPLDNEDGSGSCYTGTWRNDKFPANV